MFAPFLGPIAPIAGARAPTILPPPPSATPMAPLATPPVFGSNMFTGRFMAEQFTGFNPQYQVHVADQITLRMWGAYTYESTVTVDPQGNIFVPNVGPVNVLGVRNADLNRHVESRIRSIYRANVGVYATLGAAQQVKVYVTGFVVQPGLYAGLSSDSVLYYLDKAGGIDPERGSFLDVSVMRGGRLPAHFNLYDFLLDGQIEPLQLIDGDTILVAARKSTVVVAGEVANAYRFELTSSTLYASELLALARPKPSATHISIVRKEGPRYLSEYHPIATAQNVIIRSGDEVTVTADKYPGTILVRVEGANLGPHTLVLPYGARLKDATARMKPAPQANPAAAQLFRKSVAVRQKEMLDSSLRSLQAMVLTPRSSTSEEADLRQKDAQLALQFIERAKTVQPIGQVVLGPKQDAPNVLLADEDVIRIPEATNLVMVHGEVLFPNAVVFAANASVEDYVEQAGG
jgi:protein involved in polysaccharide export with SLBB domain